MRIVLLAAAALAAAAAAWFFLLREGGLDLLAEDPEDAIAEVLRLAEAAPDAPLADQAAYEALIA
jgi:hypothetical protein